MGTFYYSKPKVSVTINEVETYLRQIVTSLWPDRKYVMERSPAVPTPNPTDPHAAMWLFWLKGWSLDCAFTVILMTDGRLSYKVPRSQFDDTYADQCRVRRALIRKING